MAKDKTDDLELQGGQEPRAKEGQAIAELLRLHWNAAIPEVDLGTAVFVFKDDREES
jgi:hypothetical protein